jgi:hypothetical protein
MDFFEFSFTKFISCTAEVSLAPGQSGAKYVRGEVENAQRWDILDKKLKIVNSFKGGILLPLFGQRSFLNDRFFVHTALGYNSVGHEEPSLFPEEMIKQ